MIPALFVFNVYCVRMHCQAEGSHLTIDNLFELYINTWEAGDYTVVNWKWLLWVVSNARFWLHSNRRGWMAANTRPDFYCNGIFKGGMNAYIYFCVCMCICVCDMLNEWITVKWNYTADIDAAEWRECWKMPGCCLMVAPASAIQAGGSSSQSTSPPLTTIAGLDVAGKWLCHPGHRTSHKWTSSCGATLKPWFTRCQLILKSILLLVLLRLQ